MSHYDWEQADITLPTVQVPLLRKALANWANGRHADGLTAAKDFWKNEAKQTRSPRLYTERLEAFRQTWYVSRRESWGFGTLSVQSTSFSPKRQYPHVNETAFDAVYMALDSLRANPRQVVRADIERALPSATNRTTAFSEDEANIVLRGRHAVWHVDENNHAVEKARETSLALLFFKFLERVPWTRATGGVLVGNDEYNTDDRGAGGGANYTGEYWGPLGVQAQERHFRALGLPVPRAPRRGNRLEF